MRDFKVYARHMALELRTLESTYHQLQDPKLTSLWQDIGALSETGAKIMEGSIQDQDDFSTLTGPVAALTFGAGFGINYFLSHNTNVALFYLSLFCGGIAFSVVRNTFGSFFAVPLTNQFAIPKMAGLMRQIINLPPRSFRATEPHVAMSLLDLNSADFLSAYSEFYSSFLKGLGIYDSLTQKSSLTDAEADLKHQLEISLAHAWQCHQHFRPDAQTLGLNTDQLERFETYATSLLDLDKDNIS